MIYLSVPSVEVYLCAAERRCIVLEIRGSGAEGGIVEGAPWLLCSADNSSHLTRLLCRRAFIQTPLNPPIFGGGDALKGGSRPWRRYRASGIGGGGQRRRPAAFLVKSPGFRCLSDSGWNSLGWFDDELVVKAGAAAVSVMAAGRRRGADFGIHKETCERGHVSEALTFPSPSWAEPRRTGALPGNNGAHKSSGGQRGPSH